MLRSILTSLLLSLPLAAAAQVPQPELQRQLEPFITRLLQQHAIPAVSIAIVRDQQLVYAGGFGTTRLQDTVPANAETIHRVGSVSKLFTDLGVMQLVERGQIDLDAPVTRYLPAFAPAGQRAPITLRQLMSHRSGLLREPPAGNYFETTEPSLARMVASVNGRELIYAPGEREKYSNAAIAIVGYVLEQTQRTPFAEYLRRAVLLPMDMRSSAFEPLPELRPRLAEALMWTADNRTFPAPTFQLGMAPAGSMYSTVTDLGKFMSMLFNGGRAANGQQIVRQATLDEMWRPQGGGRTGAGLGFFIGDFRGNRVVRHGGAIYGFSTELAALPDRNIGVVVAATKDVSNTISERIANRALELMLNLPFDTMMSRPLTEPRARQLEGRFAKGENIVELHASNERLFMYAPRDLIRRELRAWRGDTLIADDALTFGMRVLPIRDAIVLGRDTLRRADLRAAPANPHQRWEGLIGEYGWDHNTLYILEKDAKLYALIEWFFFYPLEEISRDTFRFPKYGLYDNEKLVFTRGSNGRATKVEAASVEFTRRLTDIETGKTFQITPQRPVEDLRRDALAATPPVERGEFLPVDLVELNTLDPTIRYDIRYATTNNFMGAVFYSSAHAFLQRPAAEALVRAHRALRERGYGLLIHDAYRPWYVTKMFWDATPVQQRIFVADPANGSRHNRGAAVDLTLYELASGRPVEMVGGYDEFSERSYPEYPGGTSRQRWLRELLRDAMEAQGFRVYEAEWWHFDYNDWRRYPIGTRTFEQLGR